MVEPTYDDQVFDSARDEQLAIFDISEVSGAQKWPLPSLREIGLKSLFGLLIAIPISTRDMRSCHPNFPYFLGWTWGQRFGIDYDHTLARQDRTATDSDSRAL